MTRSRPRNRVAAAGLAGALLLTPGLAGGAGAAPGTDGLPDAGPELLHAGPADAPQLQNTGIWEAEPLLVSGATAYRDGEFLYQDFLYDDHGARGLSDPNDPRAGNDFFSRPGGSLTYPTAPEFAENAADLVELRVRPLDDATAFRITYNTLLDPDVVATTIAIGDSPVPLPMPHGANTDAPAELFLTVAGDRADLLDAVTLTPAGSPPTVAVDLERRQVEVRVPHSSWDPGASTVRLAAGVGTWDATTGTYRAPQPSRDATTPGGGFSSTSAFFNVAFRGDEPLPTIDETLTDPAWWRDSAQGEALAAGDLSPFFAEVDFGALQAGTDDESDVPTDGPLNLIYASRFEPAQGVDYAASCGTENVQDCPGVLQGRLQPYALYVPADTPADGFGMTLLLHSLQGNYNQYTNSLNQEQYGERDGGGHVVLTPTGRGPDGWYHSLAAADVFEAWADAARRYPLDPTRTVTAGYSMGGYGTYKLATQFPDLFAAAQTTVGPPGVGVKIPPGPPSGGPETDTAPQLPSVRHVPFDNWAGAIDELVPIVGPIDQNAIFDRLGYRYRFRVFTADHFFLAIHDQYDDAAEFLADREVLRDPRRVTYVRSPAMDEPELGIVADSAYWVSAIALLDDSGAAPRGTVDVVSEGFGEGDPEPLPTTSGTGTLGPGTFGELAFTEQRKRWGDAPETPVRDALTVHAANVSTLAVDVERARVTCAVEVDIVSETPVEVVLEGCNRVVRGGGPTDRGPDPANGGGPGGPPSGGGSNGGQPGGGTQTRASDARTLPATGGGPVVPLLAAGAAVAALAVRRRARS